MAKEKGGILHGNSAQVDKNKKVVPLYITNAVTMSDTKDGAPPVIGDENVQLARDFSVENKQ